MSRVWSMVPVSSSLFRTDGETNLLLMSRLEGPVRFTPDERQRLASLAHGIPRKLLATYSVLATPDTLHRWYTRPPPERQRAANDEPGRGGVVRRSRLGGLLTSYTRTA